MVQDQTPPEEFMRRLVAVLGVALLAGCSDPVAAPDADIQATLEEMASLAFSVAHVTDGSGPAAGLLQRLGSLPPTLALSADQAAAIRALVDVFVAATATDREFLAALRQEAAAARQAGRPPEEIRAILARGEETRKRLATAEQALHRAVLGVLTPAQRAWITGRQPPEPRPCALTEAQRNEISTLRAAFQEENAADMALIRAVHDRARAAQAAGASRDQISAILAEAKPALERLRAAREALHASIQAVLTPQQQAAGCLPKGP
jgi:hypothetical protein